MRYRNCRCFHCWSRSSRNRDPRRFRISASSTNDNEIIRDDHCGINPIAYLLGQIGPAGVWKLHDTRIISEILE